MAFEKFKRNFGRAVSMKSSDRIRNTVDLDETSENLDYMLNRGKGPNKTKAHNRRQTEEGLKIRRQMLYETGIDGKPR